jgi:hypothetical protein
MRLTDQYFWNIIFILFFASLVVSATVILKSVGVRELGTLTLFDLTLVALATFRLTRLVVYDKITAFFREQFYDVKVVKGGMMLEKPHSGPRRTLADLTSCPWCISVWMSAMTFFFYALTEYAYYPTLFIAISGVATLLQLTANMIGWKAEELKKSVEGK